MILGLSILIVMLPTLADDIAVRECDIVGGDQHGNNQPRE